MSDIAIDLDRFAAWLTAQGTPVRTPLSAKRIGLGQSNLTYLVSDADGTQVVARRPPRGRLLESAHDVGREHRILSALAGTGVPVPRMLGYARPGEVEADVPVVEMEFVTGLVVNEPEDADRLSHEARHRIGIEMAQILATLHGLDLDRLGLADLASHSPYAPRQLKRWSAQLEASRTEERPQLDRLTQLLQRNVPTDTSIALVHGDFHLRNVIVDPDSGQVRAALDWELSTLGDPLADIGSLLAYWPQRGETATGLFDAAAEPGFATRAELADAYLTASGRDGRDLAFWHVLGLWKIAIIIEGIRRRAMDTPSNAARSGPPPAALVDAIVDRAWHEAQAAGLA